LTYASAQNHDARINRLAKDPVMLVALLRSPDIRKRLLAVSAMTMISRQATLQSDRFSKRSGTRKNRSHRIDPNNSS
jgi:hypothetical protein